MAMNFLKITGSGNDFVLCDNRNVTIRKRADMAKTLCRQKFGVGADGLILLEKSRVADFRMRIFNPDGSEAEMCGNGLRCFIRFIREMRISKKNRFRIETLAGIYETSIRGRAVSIKMKLFSPPQLNLLLRVHNQNLTVHFLNSGVPHAVILSENIHEEEVEHIGRAIRYHSHFAPKGTNVDWLQVVSPHQAYVRTYERGVEGETLACGTGIVASAACGALLELLTSPVEIIARSGESLSVQFSSNLEEIFFEGNTLVAFQGSWIGK
jgi:diaminopimelate epimerase